VTASLKPPISRLEEVRTHRQDAGVNPSGEGPRESHLVSGTAVLEERESADGDRTCSFGVARHARRDACEDVEAAAVQRLQLVQARSAASDHTSLTCRMSDFFS